MTVSLNGEFIGPAKPGDLLVTSTGEVIKAGGSLLFIRGLISTGTGPMPNFSGVIKTDPGVGLAPAFRRPPPAGRQHRREPAVERGPAPRQAGNRSRPVPSPGPVDDSDRHPVAATRNSLLGQTLARGASRARWRLRSGCARRPRDLEPPAPPCSGLRVERLTPGA
ncbi:hypothetical protein ACRAWD_03870 [Caulobacter segnis]